MVLQQDSANDPAVRVASELNLHRCITKMPHKKLECYERTRLYFLVCIVDHRCSITFGRPPMTRGVRHGMSPRDLLSSGFSQNRQSDMELVAEVELWSITASVFENFGADIERRSTAFVEDLERYEARYDKWYQEWSPILSPIAHLLRDKSNCSTHQISRLPMLTAKLFLYSHIFRGPGQRQNLPPVEVSRATNLQYFALRAVECAMELVRIMAEMIEHYTFAAIAQSYLGFTTAFASVVLRRISESSENLPDIPLNTQTTTELLTRLHDALQKASDTADNSAKLVEQPMRPLTRLAHALERLLSSTDSQRKETDIIDNTLQENYDLFAFSHVHTHSPFARLNDGSFRFDLVGNDLLTGNGFDWPFDESLADRIDYA